MNVLIDVTLPETGDTHRMTVREGEEFHKLKFVQILGANRGIVLEYMPTGETFEVLK